MDFQILKVFHSLSTQPSTHKAINLNLAYSGLLQGHLTCHSLKYYSDKQFLVLFLKKKKTYEMGSRCLCVCVCLW